MHSQHKDTVSNYLNVCSFGDTAKDLVQIEVQYIHHEKWMYIIRV